jgi:hypothetical protein
LTKIERGLLFATTSLVVVLPLTVYLGPRQEARRIKELQVSRSTSLSGVARRSGALHST